jgi:hypothetical protein
MDECPECEGCLMIPKTDNIMICPRCGHETRDCLTWINPPDSIEGYQGFVYEIHELSTGKKYIGKKNFWKTIKRKPLKGKKRRRRAVIETDWKVYNSSNEELKYKIANNPSNYVKRILWLCESKMDMALREAYAQLEAYFRGDWNQYYNEVINLRLRVRK